MAALSRLPLLSLQDSPPGVSGEASPVRIRGWWWWNHRSICMVYKVLVTSESGGERVMGRGHALVSTSHNHMNRTWSTGLIRPLYIDGASRRNWGVYS